MVATTSTRERRAPGEARQQLLATARRLFTKHGYAGTTTKQIAGVAGVAEPLLFRHFGSKANLFEEAMLEPYRTFIADFMDRWQEELRQPEELEVLTRRFVLGLYELMREHRRLFLALIAARAFEGAVARLDDGFGESDLSRQLDRFDRYLRASSAAVPPKYLDSAVSFRLIVGAVMAATVLDEWLFPAGTERPSESRIEQELTKFTLFGVAGKRPR